MIRTSVTPFAIAPINGRIYGGIVSLSMGMIDVLPEKGINRTVKNAG
jgi:hypothetical protein